MSAPFVKTCGFQAVAHRGYSGAYAENTLLSFEKAYEAGATMLELDVRLTADDRVVILHDATLTRLTGSSRPVSRLRWDLLRTLEIHVEGAREVQTGKIPLLQELFEQFGKRLFYYIEVKHTKSRPNDYHFALCRRVIELLAQYQLEEHALVVSFEVSLLEWLRQASEDLSLGWNFRTMRMYDKYGARANAVGAEICPHESLCTAGRIATWKEQGLMVMPWVVNDRLRMKELITLGVDGITTDEIPELIPLLPKDTLCKR